MTMKKYKAESARTIKAKSAKLKYENMPELAYSDSTLSKKKSTAAADSKHRAGSKLKSLIKPYISKAFEEGSEGLFDLKDETVEGIAADFINKSDLWNVVTPNEETLMPRLTLDQSQKLAQLAVKYNPIVTTLLTCMPHNSIGFVGGYLIGVLCDNVHSESDCDLCCLHGQAETAKSILNNYCKDHGIDILWTRSQAKELEEYHWDSHPHNGTLTSLHATVGSANFKINIIELPKGKTIAEYIASFDLVMLQHAILFDGQYNFISASDDAWFDLQRRVVRLSENARSSASHKTVVRIKKYVNRGFVDIDNFSSLPLWKTKVLHQPVLKRTAMLTSTPHSFISTFGPASKTTNSKDSFPKDSFEDYPFYEANCSNHPNG